MGMASNILGLPLGRLDNKSGKPSNPNAAAILYGEGLGWLEKFRKRLDAFSP
jgi:hypothetical protein